MTRLTRRERVLAYLVAELGDWVPGYDLTQPGVGGSEGLRRVRELRDGGYRIEHRQMEGGDAYEYRLLSSHF